MTPLSQAPLIFAFAKKIYAALQSLPVLFISAATSLTLTQIFDQLIADTPLKDLVLPILVGGVCFFLYFITFLLDFASGVRASKKEALDKKNYFLSDKGWSSIWKISAVTVIVLGCTSFAILSALAGWSALHMIFMMIAGAVSIMATSFDIFSIGENYERSTGKKARIFIWLGETGESLGHLLKEQIYNRIKKLGS